MLGLLSDPMRDVKFLCKFHVHLSNYKALFTFLHVISVINIFEDSKGTTQVTRFVAMNLLVWTAW